MTIQLEGIQPRASAAVLEEVYQDLERLIARTAEAFARRYYQTDPEEIHAEALKLFLEAYHTYEAERGELAARVKAYIWNALLSRLRVVAHRNATVRFLSRDISRDRCSDIGFRKTKQPQFDGYGGGDSATCPPAPFFEDELALSPDGATAVRLLLDTPPDLLAAIQAERVPSPTTVRGCLRRYLRDVMQWGDVRIGIAFRNVAAALELHDEAAHGNPNE